MGLVLLLMTAREMTDAIGKSVYFTAGNFKFACWVKDVKVGWGQPRFLIIPFAGTGERWVEFSSIEPMTNINALGKISQQNQLTSSRGSQI